MSLTADISKKISFADGLVDDDAEIVRDLVDVWRRKRTRNLLRACYYDMHQKPKELGISVPPHLRSLEQVIGWPAKAVDALAARSQFDGYVAEDDSVQKFLNDLVARNGMKRMYRQGCISQLKQSCAFMTVVAGDGTPVVRTYPALAASALWSFERNRIRAGLVVVDSVCLPDGRRQPTWVNVFTDDAVIRIRKGATGWSAKYLQHSMGRCLMEPLSYGATLERPFGKSRITRSVMNLTDDAMRESVRSEISAEFFTSPQRYLLGASKGALGSMSKWDAYIGNIFAIGRDKDGNIPQYGQLAQGSMQPHVDYMRSLAARFSGETNVPVSQLGVIHDNPSSAEAIFAANEAMVIDAQNLNADNGDALMNIGAMALAINMNTDYEGAMDLMGVAQARFRNPAMPSVVSQADAITKMISAIPWMAESAVALEELGFTDDKIQRLIADKKKAQAGATIRQLMATNGAANANSAQSS